MLAEARTPPHAGAPPLRIDRLAPYLHRIKETPLLEKRGHVTQLIGLVIESAGPMCAVGDVCRIEASSGDNILAEVVGFRGDCVLLMPLREVHGIQPGSPVIAVGKSLKVPVGPELKGRVIDALGHPMDDLGPLRACRSAPILNKPPNPLTRQRIKNVF